MQAILASWQRSASTLLEVNVRDDTKVALGVGVALAAVVCAWLWTQRRSTGFPPSKRSAENEARSAELRREESEQAAKILEHLRRGPKVRSARPEDNVHLPKIVKDCTKREDWDSFDEDAIVRKSKKAAALLGITETELRESVRKAKEAMEASANGEGEVEPNKGSSSVFYVLDKLFLVVVLCGFAYVANKEQDGAVIRSLLRAFPREARVLGFDVDSILGQAVLSEEESAVEAS